MSTVWIYKHRNTNWERLPGAICLFNAVENQSGVWSEADFWKTDEKFALTVEMKIPTILTKWKV